MPASEPPPDERRAAERYDVDWAVDCETHDTFLYASITNISKMGIFVRTDEPLTIGTEVRLTFAPRGGGEPFTMRGCVQWVNRVQMFGENLNPGMGVRFLELQPEERERVVAAIRTIAYLRDEPGATGEN